MRLWFHTWTEDSAGELLAEPDKFAILHEDLDDKLSQHPSQRAVPVLDWDQNQALVLPPPTQE